MESLRCFSTSNSVMATRTVTLRSPICLPSIDCDGGGDVGLGELDKAKALGAARRTARDDGVDGLGALERVEELGVGEREGQVGDKHGRLAQRALAAGVVAVATVVAAGAATTTALARASTLATRIAAGGVARRRRGAAGRGTIASAAIARATTRLVGAGGELLVGHQRARNLDVDFAVVKRLLVQRTHNGLSIGIRRHFDEAVAKRTATTHDELGIAVAIKWIRR
jgi:hypothetical protein